MQAEFGLQFLQHQEVPLLAVIITGKYLASQCLIGTACDGCFTNKTLIFSVLYCISNHLETALEV